MEDENVQEGLTFGEIWRMVLRRIWYILGAAALVTVIAVLIVYFAVNPGARSYSMEFSLVFPTGSEYSYPDGEPFFYQTMISAESLNEAKKGEGLTGINTDQMIRDNRISIQAATVTEGGTTRYTGRYTVTAKSTYFSGTEQAEKFIRAIAQATVDRMRAEAGSVDYAVSEETFGGAPFEERLNLLAEERETLIEKYDEWISIYDAAYKLKVGETERSLKEFRATVNALYGESVQEELENELRAGGYYYTDNFEAYTQALRREYKRNETEISKLKEAAVQNTAYTVSAPVASPLATVSSSQQEGGVYVQQSAPNVSQRLAELIERNANILHWLGADYLAGNDEEEVQREVKGTLTAEKNTAFAQKLDAERAKLAGAAAELTAVTKAIYERGMQARFDMQKVKTEGGVSILLVAVAAFVVCFLLACFVACAADRSRRKKAGHPTSEAEAQPEEPKEE